MPLYSSIISDIRTELGDEKRSQRDVFSGNGSTTKYVLSERQIEDDSYTVSISGTPKVEGTHYTMNKESGEVTFTTGNAPAAASDNVVVIYEYSNARDLTYLKWLNDGVRYFRRKLWNEVIDGSSLTTTADANEIDLSPVSARTYKVIEVWYKPAVSPSDSLPWTKLTQRASVKFVRDLNQLQIDPFFANSDWPIKVRIMEDFEAGDEVTDDLDIPEEFTEVYETYAKYKYYKMLIAQKVRDLAAVSSETSAESFNALRALAKDTLAEARDSANKVKRATPSIRVPIIKKSLVRRIS